MKGKPDLVRGWLRKAASDLVAMKASATAGAPDAACFHAQQAAEKYLKAYLLDQDRPILHSHNLYKLFALCAEIDPSFNQWIDTADLLTPFAVEARYDTEFWPSSQTMELAEEAANRIAKFVSARMQSVGVKVPVSGLLEAWKTERRSFDYRVDLGKFEDARLHPGFFNRVIEPGDVVQFEDAFRAALVPGGRVETAAEVVFWKNYTAFKAKTKITRNVFAKINNLELWGQFVSAVTTLATTPTWESLRALKEFCGGFATPLTFLSFYDPWRFPMVDRRIGEWWSRRLPNELQFAWTGKVITPSKQSWAAYLAWTEFCRRQAASLSTMAAPWRARDVEMAVWTDTRCTITVG